MSRALLYRSIPLSITTRNAWREAGCMFAKRERTPAEVQVLAGSRPIINLGSSNMHIDGIWNHSMTVAPLLSPQASRQLLTSLMPSDKWQGEGYYWLKGQGRGGANKEKLYVTTEFSHDEVVSRAAWMKGDVQQNIVGDEYRVITVGAKVVQSMRRTGMNGDRAYQWVGVRHTPSPVKELVRSASRQLDSEKTIIGWDVIESVHGGAFILEGNACPGVNSATAARILDAMEGVEYAV